MAYTAPDHLSSPFEKETAVLSARTAGEAEFFLDSGELSCRDVVSSFPQFPVDEEVFLFFLKGRGIDFALVGIRLRGSSARSKPQGVPNVPGTTCSPPFLKW